ncbi:MAG: putative DNA binding domain-containing protein [Rhodobacteraceae bacterium]|nr:putative DNA binding domain-containing protein [Paracoccaceae bacterium]
MQFSDTEIRKRLRLGENYRWGFKQVEFKGDRIKSPSRQDFADEMTAFANADGGVILCGVTDQGKIQGMDLNELASLDKLLVEVAKDTIKPSLKIKVDHRELDGKAYILTEVIKSNSVHDRDGRAYIRVGASKNRLEGDERSSLTQNREQSRFTSYDMQIVPNTGFNTLDPKLWEPLLSFSWADNPLRGLKNLRLIGVDDAGQDRATVAGILLCTERPEDWLPQATIMATHYQGQDRASGQLDAQEIVGPLNIQIAHAVKFIKRNMRNAARKVPERKDIPEYSIAAVFEAVVNAVLHRDYSLKKRRIRLSMFNEHLEIDSPGSVPNGMTIESMDISQATRNEVIASVFGRIPVGDIPETIDRKLLMERRGDGVSIIKKKTFAATGKYPSYELVDKSNLLLKIPATKLEFNPATSTINVCSDGRPLDGVNVLALFPNETWQQATTNENGEAVFNLHTANLPMTVFSAKHGYSGEVIQNWLPSQGGKVIELTKMPSGGSTIFPNGTGNLPDLKGRLNPILDTSDRTYLYADNIAVEDGQQQPVTFRLGKPLKLTDAYGTEKSLTILAIIGHSSLLVYRSLE